MTDSTELKGSTTEQEQCKRIFTINGYFMLITLLSLIGIALLIGFGIIGGYEVRDRWGEIQTIAPYWWFSFPLGLGAAFCLLGFNVIGPNEVRVAQFFGTPLGVYDKQGFSWCNPLISMTKYTYKIRNFETDQLKINDKDGSPINVAAVIRWHVFNPEKAEYELENYLEFLRMQVEGNLRNVIRSYAYDSATCKDGEQTELTLSHSTEEVTEEILTSINEDITPFGLKAVDVSFNSLAYAPEIAAVMTQRQQAKAIVESKRELSEGVVEVVESTIEKLKASDKVEISKNDESRLATNLTLLLCSHKEADPVINIDN